MVKWCDLLVSYELTVSTTVPAGWGGSGDSAMQGHQATEDADEFERDVDGGKQKVSWSSKREFHTRQTDQGLEAVSVQVRACMCVCVCVWGVACVVVVCVRSRVSHEPDSRGSKLYRAGVCVRGGVCACVRMSVFPLTCV